MKKDISVYFIVFLCLLIIGSCSKKADILKENTNSNIYLQKPVVTVPAAITITLPEDSVSLTGTGTDSTGIITTYLWSEVSGPNTATLIHAKEASAVAKKLIAGTYVFEFSVTDNHAQTARDTVSVTVNPALVTTQTLSISPTYNPDEFCLGYWGGNDWSNPTSIEEPISAWTKDSSPTLIRDLLKFDLSGIPAGATITKADLYLYSDTIPTNGDLVHANAGADNSLLIQQVANAWDPLNLNWFNQPAGLTANEIIVPSTDQPYLNIDIDVIGLISPMVTNNANYGFLISLKNEVEYTSRIFCSSYNIDDTKHPKLVIKYKK